MSAASRLLVTLCTYNERENLTALIPEIRRYAPDGGILVVDDNSPDGTGGVADEWATRDRSVRVIHRAGKLGLGTAMIAAFRFAFDHNYDFLINLDADFSHRPRYIPALLALMEQADVAIGSRYVAGGGVLGWGVRRRFMSRAINLYARTLLRLKTRDNSGSYRCYRLARLRKLDFTAFVARGYAFQEEILYRCRRIGCTFVETPIVFEDRRCGTSKMSLKETLAAGWIIFRLAVSGGFA